MVSLSYAFRVGQSIVSGINLETSLALYDCNCELRKEFSRVPRSSNEFQKVPKSFKYLKRVRNNFNVSC